MHIWCVILDGTFGRVTASAVSEQGTLIKRKQTKRNKKSSWFCRYMTMRRNIGHQQLEIWRRPEKETWEFCRIDISKIKVTKRNQQIKKNKLRNIIKMQNRGEK